MELPDTDDELLALNKGVKLATGVPEFGPLAEPAGEELTTAVIDPTELRDL